VKGEKKMAHVLWHFKVEDYARWKSVFDEDPTDRGSNGSKGGIVFRNAKDANEVLLLLEWDDNKLEQLRALAQSPQMKEIQERSGYTGEPEVLVLKVDDKPSV
jgi:heme-degrading monooxygenase HmoA